MRTFRNLTIAGLAAAFSLAANVAMADDPCTIDNWSIPVGLSDADVGTPASGNRRFAGPCGLRVPVDGIARYLVDSSPIDETSYNARFYVFLNDVNGDVTLFRALDGSDSVIELEYVAASNQVRMVLDGTVADTSAALESGWNTVAVSWSVQDTAEARLTVNGTAGDIKTPSNTARRISSVQLGSIATGSGAAGTIDFDEFDSRRASVPENLCRGLTDMDRPIAAGQTEQALSVVDVQAIFDEVASRGQRPAGGQPDFNMDGLVTIADVQDVFDRIARRQGSCGVNR